MSLTDERKALLAKIERLQREEAITQAQLQILEDAARRMAAVEHPTLHNPKSRVNVQPVQEQSSESRGVRIARGRKNGSMSRNAQLAIGLTDKDVAEKLKVSRSTVCKWHTGDIAIPDEHKAALAKLGIPDHVWRKK